MDTTVYFKKLNNVKGQIICEDFDFVIQLREYFSFFADGYKFNPKYKNKQWDGKIRMLKTSGEMALGLWSEVKAVCERFNRRFILDPQIQSVELQRDRLETFVESLDVHTDGESIYPYHYQIDAVHHALQQQRCLLLSPTSSGKSMIQYILTRVYNKLLSGKILVVVPTVSLVTQMRDDFLDYSSANGWGDDIHIIKAGCEKYTDKRVVISTYQSLTKLPKDYFHQFESVMVDEVHTAKSKSIIGVLDNCINAQYRVGLTGTLDDLKTNELTLVGMFGKVYTVITTHELMEQQKVASLNITAVMLEYADTLKRRMRSREVVDDNGNTKRVKATYQEEIDVITECSSRNEFIVDFSMNLKGNTIVMINKKKHATELYDLYSKKYPNKNVYVFTGSTKADVRDEIKKRMETEDGSIIIGSLGVISTGVSIKRLHNMIFAHPSKSRIKTLQSVGRLLRLSKYGNEVMMYDLIDDFAIGAYENYTLEHGRKRIEFYSEQKFNYTIVNKYIGECNVGED